MNKFLENLLRKQQKKPWQRGTTTWPKFLHGLMTVIATGFTSLSQLIFIATMVLHQVAFEGMQRADNKKSRKE